MKAWLREWGLPVGLAVLTMAFVAFVVLWAFTAGFTSWHEVGTAWEELSDSEQRGIILIALIILILTAGRSSSE